VLIVGRDSGGAHADVFVYSSTRPGGAKTLAAPGLARADQHARATESGQFFAGSSQKFLRALPEMTADERRPFPVALDWVGIPNVHTAAVDATLEIYVVLPILSPVASVVLVRADPVIGAVILANPPAVERRPVPI
jgi:hypothetical protein